MSDEMTDVVAHVRLTTGRPIEEVRSRLESNVPKVDPALFVALRSGDTREVERRRKAGPPLWIFEMRDHGSLLAPDGIQAKCYQYEIGNPLTAETMTRETLAAALYAPLRIVLYADAAGTIAEYDRPSSLIGQLGNEAATKVARMLDEALASALAKALGYRDDRLMA